MSERIQTMNTDQHESFIEPVLRLSEDLKKAAEVMTPREARYLVDAYYLMQDQRIRVAGQIRSIVKGQTNEPHAVLEWFETNSRNLENQMKLALGRFAKGQSAGQWLLDVCGIGPVISAGLLAHLDIEKAPTVGHYWRFAGQDPTCKWNKGEKRPWNASLKTLCFIIGESFVKFSGKEECYYGKLWIERKFQEWERNTKGELRSEAERALNEKKFGEDTSAKAWLTGCYPAAASEIVQKEHDLKKRTEKLDAIRVPAGQGVPMLPPAHIHARARRWTVKVFIYHLFEQQFRARWGKEPPKPYVIEHLGHAHFIPANPGD